MAAPDFCSMIARDIGRYVDAERQRSQGAEPGQRLSNTPTDGGFWRNFHGSLTSDLGPNVPPLSKSERISTLGLLNGYRGAPSELATLMERFENQVEISSNGDRVMFRRQIPQRMTEEEWKNVAAVIEGRPQDLDANGVYLYERGSQRVTPMNLRVAQVVPIMREYLQATAEERIQRGITNARAFSNEYPLFHNTKETESLDFRRKATQGLAERYARRAGRSNLTQDDLDRAELATKDYLNHKYGNTRSNIDREILFDVGANRIYDGEQILANYSKLHWQAMHEKSIFGSRATSNGYPQRAAEMFARAHDEYPANNIMHWTMKNYLDDSFGIKPYDPVMHSKFWSTLGNLQSLKLTMSLLKHGNLPINTWMRTNTPSMIQGVNAMLRNSSDLFGMPAREAAGMWGGILEGALHDFSLFQGRLAEGVLTYNGMHKFIGENRILSGLSGAYYAQGQARNLVRSGGRKYAQRLLELGIDPERIRANNGQLTWEDKLIAGQKVINATQSRSRMSDMPFFASGAPSLWRNILMFKSYPINQARLMWDSTRRNPIRATAFGLGIMPLAGAAGSFATHAIREDIFGKQPQDEDSMRNYLEWAVFGGSYGILSDWMHAAWVNGGQLPMIRSFEPVPASFGEDMLLAAGHLAHGKTSAFARDVGRQFGGLGAAFATYLFPPDED